MGTQHDYGNQGESDGGGDELEVDSEVSDTSDSSDSDSDMSSTDQDDNADKTQMDDEVDEEDPVIKAIVKAKEKKVTNHPPDLVLDGVPSSICFHPIKDYVSFGDYNGRVQIFSYAVEGNNKLMECKHADSSVRAHTFSIDGDQLICAYSDQTIKIYALTDDKLVLEKTLKNPNGALSSIYVIDEHLFATGDDEGYLVIWDNRTPDTPTPLRLGEDAITSMVSNDERKILVCTSEEGAIYAIKIRGARVQVESEVYKYEFNCSCIFKQESKLAVGDGNGDVYIFNWNEFGKHSDICTKIGRGEAIQAMIPITEKIVLCGGDDGFIRAYSFFPHKYLGVVGKISYPVEKMDVCNDGHLIAAVGADENVKFWNVEYFESLVVPSAKKGAEKRSGGSSGDGAKNGTNDLKKNNLPSSSHQNATDFFKGLAD